MSCGARAGESARWPVVPDRVGGMAARTNRVAEAEVLREEHEGREERERLTDGGDDDRGDRRVLVDEAEDEGRAGGDAERTTSTRRNQKARDGARRSERRSEKERAGVRRNLT